MSLSVERLKELLNVADSKLAVWRGIAIGRGFSSYEKAVVASLEEEAEVYRELIAIKEAEPVAYTTEQELEEAAEIGIGNICGWTSGCDDVVALIRKPE